MSAAVQPATAAPERRSSRVLVIVLALVVGVAVVVVALRGSFRDGPLEPGAPTAQGSKAVVRVLEDDGTDVEVRRYTADAADALADGGTVLVTDPSTLDTEQMERLSEARTSGGGQLVLVRPDADALKGLAPGVSPAGKVTTATSLQAGEDCGAAGLQGRAIRVGPAEDVSDSAALYRAGPPADSCYREGGDAAVVVSDGVVVLGSATLLTNDGVGQLDNAGVALTALGADEALTWYVPSPTDPLADQQPSLLDRLPDFALPLALWACLVAIAVLLALSRRLGPVVLEPLPVSVRARELTVGRAHLLHRADGHQAAARSLRAATSLRLASRLGVRREDRLDTLVAALLPHTSLTASQLHELLGPTPVRSDQELLRLTEALDALEKEIDR
ncbi:hypothetical protein DEO23_13810 [Brachybacterium endophyticum]|uniref:DUF4350 domain-containing protein n=1 Tax=Brachybacterium endophyticum TaxID=2182385 RepID=A0A2U2RHA5_9MICO|nr:DUF4350 domain-containing protein [Brachybacterium endophyticum]PWH05155.1 hypothetical protein DEO23_13810 [Brachybacterium endophyticum]